MLSFEFAQPWCLLTLFLTLVLVGAYRHSLVAFSKTQRRALFAVRFAILLLLALSLSGLTVLYSTHQTKTVFLVDQSKSIDATAAQAAEHFLEAAEEVSGEKLTVVPFGQDAPETDIESAVEHASALIPAGYVPHAVLLSDGNETQGNILNRLNRSTLKISTVVLPSAGLPEVQLAEIRLPAAVQKGEPFYVDTVVESNVGTEGILALYRNGFKITEERKDIEKGENIFRFQQTADNERQTEFTATVISPNDTLPENNKASNVLFADGQPKVLLIDSDPKTLRDFTSALREQEIRTTVLSASSVSSLSLDELDQYDAVILSNVPATAFSKSQLEMFRVYTGDLGGGLLMLGGEQSFGLGGYYKTPVEEVLPVWCDYEKEREKPSFALALVIDRSGSMGGQKMELAKEAAKAAAELLTPKDFIAVVAFDNSSYPISPMQSAASIASVRTAVSTIEAAGGTNIYPALNEAHQQLRQVSAKLKHIILLTDGYSMPGDADGILRATNADQITVSTVGVGDADNTLLKKIADTGRGRHYICTDPQVVPQIFAKETMTASKSSMKEEPFIPIIVTPSDILSNAALESAPPLLGFTAVRPKPASVFVLATETGEPLLMFRRFGLGMSAAFTSDVKTKWAAEWLTWDFYGTFWAQLIRKVMRKSEGRNAKLNIVQKSGSVHLTLDAVNDTEFFIDDAEGKVTLFKPDSSQEGLREEAVLKQTAPGRYEAEFAVTDTGAYSVHVTLQKDGESVFEQTRSVTINYPEELRIKPANELLLQKIANQTGGTFNPVPADVFASDPQRTTLRAVPLFPYLLTAAAFLFLLDVLLRRIDLNRHPLHALPNIAG